MASLLLVSSIGIAVNIHYCKGEANSIGIFSVAEKCDMCTEHDAVVGSADLEMLSRASCCDEDAVYNKLSANVPVVKATEIAPQFELYKWNQAELLNPSWVYEKQNVNVNLRIPIPDNKQSVLQVFLI
ncbi:MAG: hypothetical protein JXR19_06275 [Bacteroidia bacterium]